MVFSYSLKTAVTGLKTNRSRSLLTILGIVIGIAAIILIMSLGQGAQQLILNQVQGMGSKTIVVIPGREPKGPSDAAQVFSDSLKLRDYELLQKKENVPTLGSVMPLLFTGVSSSYGSETYRPTIFGVSPLIQQIFDLDVSEGEFFSDDDVRARADVVVIGSKVKEQLFGDSPALGEKIKIKDRSFRVIGIMPSKGQVSFFNFDEAVIVPYTTAQQYVLGIKYFHRFIAEATSQELIAQTVTDIKATLRESHKITDPDKDDFFVQTQEDLAARLGLITQVLTLFLAAVAAISLVVGGIGIMNIMLVSVTERTREIGLRKSIGATDRDILMQFLLEAVLLTGTGGVAGIIIGGTLSVLCAVILTNFVGLDWSFQFPFLGAFLGIVVSGVIGLVFGIYPAKQAARKSPMEALRYE